MTFRHIGGTVLYRLRLVDKECEVIQMRRRLEEFMQGRYGADEISRFIMAVTLVLLILNMFTRIPLLYLLALVFLGYGYFRMFSRNIS